MTSGGARNRSGPKKDEGSARSDALGFSLTALPAEGYKGRVPAWPLPKSPNKATAARELKVWTEAWRTPQACAWSMPSERWRIRTVALWVRLTVRCEDLEAPASLLAQLHRFADQIGMTTAGLAEMGWKVAVDEVASKRTAAKAAPAQPKRERRLRAVDGGQ